jgi:hypothetical protein
MYDIINTFMISTMISHMKCRCRAEKRMLVRETALHIHFAGKECLDVHLLKPARLDVPPGQPNVVCADDMQPAPAWLEYLFCKSHLILRWLPSKLAAWISNNHGHGLGIPPKGLPQVDGRVVECHPGKQPGPQPRRQRTASDILLHSVGV